MRKEFNEIYVESVQILQQVLDELYDKAVSLLLREVGFEIRKIQNQFRTKMIQNLPHSAEEIVWLKDHTHPRLMERMKQNHQEYDNLWNTFSKYEKSKDARDLKKSLKNAEFEIIESIASAALNFVQARERDLKDTEATVSARIDELKS